jgi:hypothetical protein
MVIKKFYRFVFLFLLVIGGCSIADDSYRELKEKMSRAGIESHESSSFHNLKSRHLFDAEIIEGELVTFLEVVDGWCYFYLTAIDLSIGSDGSISNYSDDFKVSRKQNTGCSYSKLNDSQEVISVGFESMEKLSIFNSYFQNETSKPDFSGKVSELVGERIDSRGIANAFAKIQYFNGIVTSKHYLGNKTIEFTWKANKSTFKLTGADLSMVNPI